MHRPAPHIEPVEPRQLFAVLAADPSFAGGKGAALPAGTDQQLLATHGAIYVAGVSTKGAFHVYKYTDAGTLDTTWGDGGSIRPRITRDIHEYYDSFSNPPELTYDPRTGGLIVSVDGGNKIRLERFNAEGHDDRNWATGGMVEIYDVNSVFDLQRVVPVAGKKLVLAVQRTKSDGKGGGSSDLVLARVATTGHLDNRFNHGHFATVLGGHYTATPPAGTDGLAYRVDDSRPIFGDLQITDDGFRVVAFRQRTVGRGVYIVDGGYDGDYHYTTKSNLAVESVDVTDKGKTATPVNTPLVSDRVKDLRLVTTRYTPVTAVADGDDGVVTLVRKDDISSMSYPGPLSTSVTRIKAGQVTSVKPVGGGIASVYDTSIVRNAAGLTYVRVDGSTVLRYTRTLMLDTTFADGGTAAVATSIGTLAAVDDAGRLVGVGSFHDHPVLNRLA